MDAEKLKSLVEGLRNARGGIVFGGPSAIAIASALEELASVRAELEGTRHLYTASEQMLEVALSRGDRFSEELDSLRSAALGASVEIEQLREALHELTVRAANQYLQNMTNVTELGQLREENAVLADHLTDNTCQGAGIHDTRCMKCGTRTCGEAREFLAEREKEKP